MMTCAHCRRIKRRNKREPEGGEAPREASGGCRACLINIVPTAGSAALRACLAPPAREVWLRAKLCEGFCPFE